MKNSFLKYGLIGAIAALPLTTMASCDLDSASVFDILNGINAIANSDVTCADAATYLQDSIAAEGMLVDKIDTKGDFSMALTLNASSINKLFRAANEWKYGLNVGFATIQLQIPIIQVGGCKAVSSLGYSYSGDLTNCLSFEIPLEGSMLGVGSFSASATFGIPITAEIDGVAKSSIYVDLSKAQILDIKAGGSSTIDILRDVVEEIVKQIFQEQLTKAHLFDIAAWQLGDKNIRMLAGAPRVNELEGTLTFGMYSNLLFAQSGSVDWAYEHAFPKDAELGLHIHPDLIRGLLARMMYESYVEDSVDLDKESQGDAAFSQAAAGIPVKKFTVTMADMSKDYDQAWLLQTEPDFAKYFTFAFRLWSTESICGFMDILAGLNITINDNKFEISFGNIVSGKSSGGMSLFSGILGIITQTQFFRDIMQYATFTVNFNEITVPDKEAQGGMRKAEMGSKNVEFTMDGTGISLFLNFIDDKLNATMN